MQIYLALWHVLHTVEDQTQENTAEVLLWVIGDLAGWNVQFDWYLFYVICLIF